MKVTEATLTHHPNTMDTDGLVTRRRDPANGRVHLLELTESGEATFMRLRAAAVELDRRLRRGITHEEIQGLQSLLDRLVTNVGTELDHGSRGLGCSKAAGENSSCTPQQRGGPRRRPAPPGAVYSYPIEISDIASVVVPSRSLP